MREQYIIQPITSDVGARNLNPQRQIKAMRSDWHLHCWQYKVVVSATEQSGTVHNCQCLNMCTHSQTPPPIKRNTLVRFSMKKKKKKWVKCWKCTESMFLFFWHPLTLKVYVVRTCLNLAIMDGPSETL